MNTTKILLAASLTMLTSASYANLLPNGASASSVRMALNSDVDLTALYNDGALTLAFDPTENNIRVQGFEGGGSFFNGLNTDNVGTWTNATYSVGQLDELMTVWEVGNYSVDLRAVTSVTFNDHTVTVIDDFGAEESPLEAIRDYFEVTGVGYVNRGNESVAGIFAFTGTSFTGLTNFDFSATTAAIEVVTTSTEVPAPGVFALLSLGLAGLGFSRKKRG